QATSVSRKSGSGAARQSCDPLRLQHVGECWLPSVCRLNAELRQVAGQVTLPSQILVVIKTRGFAGGDFGVQHRQLPRQPTTAIDYSELHDRRGSATMSDQRVSGVLHQPTG